jgi:hypothetical protein
LEFDPVFHSSIAPLFLFQTTRIKGGFTSDLSHWLQGVDAYLSRTAKSDSLFFKNDNSATLSPEKALSLDAFPLGTKFAPSRIV